MSPWPRRNLDTEACTLSAKYVVVYALLKESVHLPLDVRMIVSESDAESIFLPKAPSLCFCPCCADVPHGGSPVNRLAAPVCCVLFAVLCVCCVYCAQLFRNMDRPDLKKSFSFFILIV
jgi:hypothetical protein